MCCIFTCCGWMIDLIQRLWTFTMSCCISSAVCCALLTGAMSGIALGYNYSLAEYIDLKETNVSVYLKRGIFDDEIGDDMDWRRSGHQPVAGHIGEHNLRTGEPEDESSTIRSGRRLDDSILESDDRHRFEGSLMKLTAKPLAPITTESQTTIDTDKILSKYSMGSLDQMKALQSLINTKKAVDPRLGRFKAKEETKPSQYGSVNNLPHGLLPGRKYMEMPPIPGMKTPPPNSARYAVPQENINEMGKWKFPKLPPEVFTRDEVLGDYDVRPTYPMPVTPRAGPVRPTRPKGTSRPKPTPTTASTPLIGRPEANYPKSIDEDIDTFKDKLLFDAPQSFKDEDFMKEKDFMKSPKQEDEDYGDAVRGIPMRKKRHSLILDKFNYTGKNKTSTDNPLTSNEELQKKEDNDLFETLKKIELSKSSTYDPVVNNPKHLDLNSKNLIHILPKSLPDILYKEIKGEVLSTSDKLQVTTSQEGAINIMSSSSSVLKLLQIV